MPKRQLANSENVRRSPLEPQHQRKHLAHDTRTYADSGMVPIVAVGRRCALELPELLDSWRMGSIGADAPVQFALPVHCSHSTRVRIHSYQHSMLTSGCPLTDSRNNSGLRNGAGVLKLDLLVQKIICLPGVPLRLQESCK